MRGLGSCLRDVAIGIAVAIVVTQLLGAVLLFGLGGSALGERLGVDLRGTLEIELQGPVDAARSLATSLGERFDGTTFEPGTPSLVALRADDPVTPMADLWDQAALAGVEVGAFTWNSGIQSAIARLFEGDTEGVLGMIVILTLPLPVVLAIVGWRYRRRLLRDRPAEAPRPGAVRTGLLMGAVAVGVAFVLSTALARFGLEPQEQPLVTALLDAGGPALAGLCVFAVVLAPIGEELFFRGFVFERFSRDLPPVGSYGISSFLFAGVHFNPSGLPLYLALGLILAWTYAHTRSVLAAVVAHAVHNGCVLALALSLAPSVDPSAAHEPTATETRPNLVVFLVDDLGWQDTSVQLGATPSPWQEHWRTPNVERLASEGVSFTDAYASAAVCSPSRIALLTGRSPARHGSTYWILHADRDTSAAHPRLRPPAWDLDGLQPGETNLAALLSEAGYRTIHVGKAHLGARGTAGSDPTALGFDVNVAGHGAGAPGSYRGRDGFGALKNGNHVWDVPGLDEFHGEDVWLTNVLAEAAVEQIERAHADGVPFLLHFAPYAVHTPIMPDEQRVAAYADLPPVEAAYATLIEGVDDALGRVLDTLDALGVAEDTLVVFASDNGGLAAHTRHGEPHRQNAPLRSGKGAAYEGGTRVPFFVRWPGVAAAGARRDDPVVLHDLFPTLLGAAGVDVPAPYAPEVDGRPLQPLLGDDGRAMAERTLLWHQPHFWGIQGPGIEPYSAIRRGRHKLIWFHDGGRLELYDLREDPGETNDRAADEPERTAALAAALGEGLRAVGANASLEIESGEPVPWPDR